ncbi:MAG TPA: YHS domain-containing protein [Propionibacteriaceae bacterium]|nr:YHS domain-containing protein [Propionibacteriaceae bacterium]
MRSGRRLRVVVAPGLPVRGGGYGTASDRKEPAMNQQCPVCGNPVDSQQSPTATYNGETYRFCCEGCRDRFQADPESYVGQAG